MLLLFVVLLSVFVVIVGLWGWNVSRLIYHPFLALRRSRMTARALLVDAIFVSLLIVNSSCGAAANRSEDNATPHGTTTARVFTYPSSQDNSSFFVVSDGNIVNGPRIPALFNIHIPVSERGGN